MEPTKPAFSDSLMLAVKMETLRSDQRGSVTLLAGMMVFLVTMFGIIAMDTNMAIHNRIVAQNAVDSAADSAALWQARFCNLEQLLNNLHYTVDEAACIAEGVDDLACVASIALDILQYVPFCEWAAGVLQGTCAVCYTLPFVDKVQHLFYEALMPVQQGIVDAAPFLVFGYANANAYGSGADNVFDSATQTFSEALVKGVSVFSAAASQQLNNGLGDVNGVIGKTLGQIPIYAVPLNPDRLKLYVQTNQASGPPEVWDEVIPLIGDVAGDIGCTGDVALNYEEAKSEAGYTDDGDNRRDGSDENKPQWGWNDLYYKGNPGYMTWVAGVTNRDELLGLGNLSWLNGGMKNSDYNQNADQVSKTIYTGDANGNSGNYSGNLQIPAFIAIASSQIEGHPVICNGAADAKPYLITVTLPFPSDNTNSAANIFIFH